MEHIDQLISARWVLPIAPQNCLLENHSIAIKGDRIVDVLPTPDATRRYQANSTLALDEQVLMPGLINTHAHTPMSLFRGLADDLELMDWLNNHIWPAEGDIINEESVMVGSQLALAEMIRGGTTCVNDHYMFPQVTREAAIKIGMRACIGLLMMDVPTLWAKNGQEGLEKGMQIYNKTDAHPLISWSMAPHAPYTVQDETFAKIRDIAAENNLPIHIHLHETSTEIDIDMKQYGKRPIARLNDLGLLSSKLIAVHMTQLTDDEITLLQNKGVNVTHCPESNLKLASGFAPIEKLMQAGVNVSLGTDGAASNNDLDMFGELRTASFLAKAVSKNPTALPAAKALEMATINGARALGLEKEIGSLEPGKAADMIAVDLSSFMTQPIYNPISHLAYAVNRLQVSNTWIAGKQLLRDGELTTINTDELVQHAKQWAAKADQYKSKASTVTAVDTVS